MLRTNGFINYLLFFELILNRNKNREAFDFITSRCFLISSGIYVTAFFMGVVGKYTDRRYIHCKTAPCKNEHELH